MLQNKQNPEVLWVQSANALQTLKLWIISHFTNQNFLKHMTLYIIFISGH